MLALYKARVDRSLWPAEETPPLVVTCDPDDLRITAVHELALDDVPTSPIFVPRDPGADPTRSRYAGSDPGGHDGWVVVPIMNDAGFRVEVYDAADVGRGPVATLATPNGETMPFLLHSAWMPRAVPAPEVERLRFADELGRVGELPDDLAAVAREVAAELDDGVPLEG